MRKKIKEILTEMADGGHGGMASIVRMSKSIGAEIHGPFEWAFVVSWLANGRSGHSVGAEWNFGDPLPSGVAGAERFLYVGEPLLPTGTFVTLGVYEVVDAEEYVADPKKPPRVMTLLGERCGYAQCGYCGRGDEEFPQPPVGCFNCEYCGAA